ncbi:hypothetical protein BJ508DRAFT_314509 [Ascobolus immersus RN42]|uniref:Uncharacterized protein n=1 Tax=Ascobolus immersus RN42 TaxID=1160509 RepID=A0A3N4HJA2_ASCIM|nr:hypothetical protein BJ508DRAFT_314509 [Ascobolus immersus RN42]
MNVCTTTSTGATKIEPVSTHSQRQLRSSTLALRNRIFPVISRKRASPTRADSMNNSAENPTIKPEPGSEDIAIKSETDNKVDEGTEVVVAPDKKDVKFLEPETQSNLKHTACDAAKTDSCKAQPNAITKRYGHPNSSCSTSNDSRKDVDKSTEPSQKRIRTKTPEEQLNDDRITLLAKLNHVKETTERSLCAADFEKAGLMIPIAFKEQLDAIDRTIMELRSKTWSVWITPAGKVYKRAPVSYEQQKQGKKYGDIFS